jgi:hypothetical protein
MLLIDKTDNFYKSLDNHILSMDEVKSYIFYLVDYLEIGNYVTDVVSLDGTDCGRYSFDELLIRINLPRIIMMANVYFEKCHIEKDRTLFINLNILESILHEVVHGIQNCKIHEEDLAYNILFLREMQLAEYISDELYDQYYFFFSYERDAMITSIENILHIIDYNYKDKDRIFSYFLNNLYKYLVYGYRVGYDSITSPAEIINEELFNSPTPILSNIDIYDRLKLGYQIKPKNLRSFNRKKNRKILMKNNLL